MDGHQTTCRLIDEAAINGRQVLVPARTMGQAKAIADAIEYLICRTDTFSDITRVDFRPYGDLRLIMFEDGGLIHIVPVKLDWMIRGNEYTALCECFSFASDLMRSRLFRRMIPVDMPASPWEEGECDFAITETHVQEVLTFQ